ncbi:MAG: CotH kinase family protein [Bacteroidales bacterium]|nr:CotH kinase family protein [Bacteroidales bacterium]
MVRFKFQYFILIFLVLSGFTKLIAQPLINEVCPRNATVLLDEDAEASDWIEICNSGEDEIDLGGWWLSDNITNLQKWKIPELTIQPDSFDLIFASSKNRTSRVDHWEMVIHVEENWKYWIPDSNPPDNWNNIGFADTAWQEGPGGFGRGDGDDNTILPDSVATVYIRKTFSIVDTSSISYVILHMDYDDAFVAYLNGVEIARANVGWPGKYPNWNDWSYDVHEAVMKDSLPPSVFRVDMPLFKSVAVQGENVLAIIGLNAWGNYGNFSLIPFLSFAINDESYNYQALPWWFTEKKYKYHTNFGLSADGEGVYLSGPDGDLVSFIEFPYLMADQSYGISLNGSNAYFSNPTPGFMNGAGATGYAKVPYFSLQAGFYSEPVAVEITNFNAGDTIRYTLDGSWVTDTSQIYTGPIQMDSTTAIKARVFKSGLLPGKTATNTYFIGYTSQLPVFSISMNPHDLWDWEEGIYVLGPNAEPNAPHFGANFWMDWKKPVHVEFFDTAQNLGFELDADIKIHGGFSRDLPQKSLRIITNGNYDQDHIDYQLFPDREIYEFKRLILRNSGQDFNVTQFRDGIIHDIVNSGTHNNYQAYQPAVLFLNGEYWGVQNMREKIDRFYTANNFGVSVDSVDILYDNNKIIEGDYYSYEPMIAYLKTFYTVNQERYDSISKLLDIENYTDYFITEMYYGNVDWPGHNTKYWRERKASGKWRYILSDVDFGLGLYHQPTINELDRVLHGTILWSHNHLAIRRLMTYEPFKHFFINRSADLFNTVLETNRVLSRIAQAHDALDEEMQRHMPRWGATYLSWESNVQIMNYYAENRLSNVWQHYLQEFELEKTVEIALVIDSVHHGHIRINTIEPELPWLGIYFDGNPIELEAIPDSGFLFSHWSPNLDLNGNDTLVNNLLINVDTNVVFKAWFIKDTFMIQIDTPAVIISEINYRSVDTLNTKDWIELWNTDTVSYDLSGWLFRDGNDDHTFIIPEGTILLPNTYLVLCEDTSAFDSYFPEVVSRIGPFEFGLSADGEELRFYNSDSLQFYSLIYANVPPWPTDADGTGKTINFDDLETDFNDGSNWYSGCVGGSPGGPFEACDTIGVDELRTETASFRLFPNPAKSEAFLQVNSKTKLTITIELFDFTGIRRYASEQIFPANETILMTIPLNSLGKGVYLVSIKGADFNLSQKLIIR